MGLRPSFLFVDCCVLFCVDVSVLLICELFLVIDVLHVSHFSELQGLYFTSITGVSLFFFLSQ